MAPIESILWFAPPVVSVCAALAAGVMDARRFRIPQILTASLCLSGIAFHAGTAGVRGVVFSLLGMAVGATVVLWFFLIRAMSGGDLRLLMGIGAWLGPEKTVLVFVVAGLASGVYSLGALARDGSLRAAWTPVMVWLLQLRTLVVHLGKADRTEAWVRAARSRWRVLPFALMVCIGIAAVVAGGYQGLMSVK